LAVDVTVTADGGDLMVFEAGLSCSWHVRTQVRKNCHQCGGHADTAPANTA
jgi:hypothetical protein